MFKQKLLKCTKYYLRKMISLSFAENIRFFLHTEAVPLFEFQAEHFTK